MFKLQCPICWAHVTGIRQTGRPWLGQKQSPRGPGRWIRPRCTCFLKQGPHRRRYDSNGWRIPLSTPAVPPHAPLVIIVPRLRSLPPHLVVAFPDCIATTIANPSALDPCALRPLDSYSSRPTDRATRPTPIDRPQNLRTLTASTSTAGLCSSSKTALRRCITRHPRRVICRNTLLEIPHPSRPYLQLFPARSSARTDSCPGSSDLSTLANLPQDCAWTRDSSNPTSTTLPSRSSAHRHPSLEWPALLALSFFPRDTLPLLLEATSHRH